MGREQFVVINMTNDMDTEHTRWVPSILEEVNREREEKGKQMDEPVNTELVHDVGGNDCAKFL